MLNALTRTWPSMRRLRKIHFVGIGGAGMCGIAEVLLTEGYQISGSDLQFSSVTNHLQALGALIQQGHHAEHIQDVDVVVQSSAIGNDNPEIVAARAKHIPVVRRAEMLAELMRFRYGIAVAGTHGKTTTTSLIASILAEDQLDPTFVIGGLLNSVGTNGKLGAGSYLVAEADESDASFLFLKPMMTVVTNIDADHMETYDNDFEQLKQTFLRFLHYLPFYGLAVICTDDLVVNELRSQISRPTLSYGFNDKADVQAIDYRNHGLQSHFIVKRQGTYPPLSVVLNLAGRHNVLNALAAISVATELGVSDQAILNALAKFSGIGRRFQLLGYIPAKEGQALMIDDYGHHPREIKATIDTVRSVWPAKRLVMVFQPHRYTRTRALLKDFAAVLSEVDQLILLKVYAAGEAPLADGDETALSQAILQHQSVFPLVLLDESTLRTVLSEVLQADDVVLMQGAGSISKLAKQLLTEGA